MPARKKENDDQISRFWPKINLVTDIASVFSSNPPIKSTFLKVLDRIQKIIPFTDATLSLYDNQKARLYKEITIGEKIEPFDPLLFKSYIDFSSWAVKQKTPILLSGIRNSKKLENKPIGSFLVIPLIVNEKFIGLICFAHKKTEFFKDKMVKLLNVLGDQIAISLERLIYMHELEIKNKELIYAQKMLKMAQQRLINNERLSAVREIAVSINHEINNPLSVIIGNVQYLLCIENSLNEKVIERLKIVENQALRIAGINHDLLQIDTLVSETYLNGGHIKMINIEKSSTGTDYDWYD